MSERLRYSKSDHAFWGPESLDEKPVEDLYGPLEGESFEDYRARLEMLKNERATDRPTRKELKANIGPETDDSPESVRKRMREFGVVALTAYAMDEQLENSDLGKNANERTAALVDKAEYLTGAMQRLRPSLESFRGVRSDAEIAAAKEKVRQCERSFASDYGRNQEVKGICDQLGRPALNFTSAELRDQFIENYKADNPAFWQRAMEPIIYSLATYGALDDPVDGRPVRPIYTSTYDDYENGVDCALEIPFTRQNSKTGQEVKGYIPIALDLTAARSFRALDNKFNQNHQEITYQVQQSFSPDDTAPRRKSRKFNVPEISAHLDFAKKDTGEVIDPSAPILKYIVGLDPQTIQDGFLAAGKQENPDPEIMYTIYEQIYYQSQLKMHYLRSEIGTENLSKEQIKQYNAAARIANEMVRRREHLDDDAPTPRGSTSANAPKRLNKLALERISEIKHRAANRQKQA